MKVRNIAFSGFAAVILASVCGNAMAVSLASKNYVDDGLATKASIEDFENLESTVGKKATQEALKEVADQVVINTNDIAELKAKGYITDEDLTNLQTALEGAIAEKPDASELEDLKTAVESLQKGTVDKTVVESLQTTVETISNDYASKSELTAAEERLQAAINNIDLSAYATTAYVNEALASKADKSELTGLVTSTQLSELRTALETEIAKKQAAGNYAEAEALQNVATELSTLKNNVYTKEVIDQKIADAISGGEIDLSGYATTSALEALTALVNGKQDKLTAGANVEIVNNTISANVDLSGLATSTELTNLQAALESAIAEKQEKGDYLTAADLTELSNEVAALKSGKADASMVSSIQETIGKLGDTYASKSELTSAEERLQAAIDNIDLTAYAKTAYVNEALALKADKSELTTLATTEALNNLQSTLQAAINEKQAAGDYLTAADLTELSNEVAALKSGKADASMVSSIQETIGKLGDTYASKSELTSAETRLQAAIDAINVPSLEDYAKLTDLENFLTAANLKDLETAVEALELADTSMDTAIKALQGGMITEDDLNAKVGELTAADKSLQDAITALENNMPSTEGLVDKTYVDDIKSNLESADSALQAAISAIKAPDVDKAYVDNAIVALNTAISNLQGADSSMSQTISGLQTALANAATKEEIKDFITSSAVDTKIESAVAGLATAEDIKDFVTSGKLQEEVAKLATKNDIASFVTSTQVSEAITSATEGLASKEELVDFVKSGDLATAIATEIAKSDFATKTELNNVKNELQAAIDKLTAGDVELTNYYTKEEADELFATKGSVEGKQDKLTAGAGINITGNTISASVDTSTLITKPAEQPDTFGEYVLILNINEAGESEGYSWLDTLDLIGGVEEI